MDKIRKDQYQKNQNIINNLDIKPKHYFKFKKKNIISNLKKRHYFKFKKKIHYFKDFTFIFNNEKEKINL